MKSWCCRVAGDDDAARIARSMCQVYAGAGHAKPLLFATWWSAEQHAVMVRDFSGAAVEVVEA